MSEEREVLDVDVLFVGGGPANLACALHLAKLLEGEEGLDETFLVLDATRPPDELVAEAARAVKTLLD